MALRGRAALETAPKKHVLPKIHGRSLQRWCHTKNPELLWKEKTLHRLIRILTFPARPPPPALILQCMMAQGPSRNKKKRLCNRLPNHGNIKAGGEGAAYLQVAMPEYSGARFLLSTVRRFYICTSSTGLHVYAHTLTRSRLPGILPVRPE